jgi:pimeloyl-ACP methyl ester carboxylesterase
MNDVCDVIELASRQEGAEAVLAEFTRAFHEGGVPDFSKARMTLWARGADALIDRGELELATFCVRQIHRAWPESIWARTQLFMLERMPAANPRAGSFADDVASPVQLASRPDAESVILVFCGADQGIGMPLPMLHRWLSQWHVSVIFLRDYGLNGYLRGIEAFAPDFASTVSALRRVLNKLRARRVICYGASIGGYGALRYGLELGAETVICMSGLVNMRPEFNAPLLYAKASRDLQEKCPGVELDVRQAYLRAPRTPKCWLVYGGENREDRIHARYFADAPGAVTIGVRGYKAHNPAAQLIRLGLFADVLRRALGSWEGAHLPERSGELTRTPAP